MGIGVVICVEAIEPVVVGVEGQEWGLSLMVVQIAWPSLQVEKVGRASALYVGSRACGVWRFIGGSIQYS